MARVLVIEDSEAIRVAVQTALTGAGHEALARADGAELEQELVRFHPDLVLLDLRLPGRDGFALLGLIRAHSSAGVVIMTARDAVGDRVHGLRCGADDYVVKPFVLEELLARVDSVLRRTGSLPAVVDTGELVLDPQSSSVLRGGARIELTATELRLLDYLAAHRGRVLSKTQLLDAVWGYQEYDPNLVEVHVSALRRKLEAHGPRLVHTVRGNGYVFRTEAAE
ncbi:response regulator transcription factor [Sciscionella sediminilitoris]|uniref:response regulator transcription factor n=1 Tax=Sciscionella sediminilitoris TaxID=1445613 RepID=UPI0004DEFE11|nr:response regulator transcription factor [Sciscionella sp. SE31]